jgi:hypothetical protein
MPEQHPFKVLVIGGNKERWSFASEPEKALTSNGVEAWVAAFQCDYVGYNFVKPDEISRYDLIIGNTNEHPHLYALQLRLMEARKPNAKWVSLIEGNAEDYLYPQKNLQRLLNAADLVNCINKNSLPLFRALSKTKTEAIGIPYPLDLISAQTVPIAERRKEIFLCPFLLSRWNDYLVARESGLPYYGYEKNLTRKFSEWRTILKKKSVDKDFYHHHARRVYEQPNLTIRRKTGVWESLLHNRSAWFWLNLDERYTWGRYVLDAAALQIPIITTRNTGHAETLFPLTTLGSPFDIDAAVALAKRLATDEAFYHEVATYPIGKLDGLRYEQMVQKLLAALSLA